MENKVISALVHNTLIYSISELELGSLQGWKKGQHEDKNRDRSRYYLCGKEEQKTRTEIKVSSAS